MFELEGFITDCREALKETDSRMAVNEVVTKAVSQPEGILKVLGEPDRAEAQKIYRADDLTILKLVWGPGMEIFPHDHRMWAVIGIYSGQEDNTFFRREEEGLQKHGLRILETRDVAVLGENAIHAVKNPLTKHTAALHVYGGDFFDTPRSEWDADTLEEQAYSVERTMKLFEDANKAAA